MGHAGIDCSVRRWICSRRCSTERWHDNFRKKYVNAVNLCLSLVILNRVALQGLGCSGIMCLGDIILADLVPLKQRGLYIGIVNMVFVVAAAIGPLIGGTPVTLLRFH